MMAQCLDIMRVAVKACVAWFTQLVSATGSQGVILAAFAIVLIIGLLFIPMRGGNIVANYQDMADFTKSKVNKRGTMGFKYSSKSSKAGRKTSLGTVKE